MFRLRVLCILVDLPSKLPVREVLIHRSHVLKDIIDEFKDPAIVGCTLSIAIVDERGNIEDGRGSGVTREVVSLFWQQFFPALTMGATEKIPSIRHDYQRQEWEAVGRFMVFGYYTIKYFPVSLSCIFLVSCLFGEEAITHDLLLESFYKFLPIDEAETLKKSTSNDFDPQDEDLLDILSSYKCYKNPTKENISMIVSQLAHQELIQKPRYISNCWGPILQPLKNTSQFSNIEIIKQLYDKKKPSPKDVVKILIASPSSDSEVQAFEYLKKFIKTLSQSSLELFLQYSRK